MSGVGCLVITDGRGEYLEQMWASLMWDGPDFAHTVLVDDSGDPEYARWCQELIGPTVFVHHQHRRGLAASIQSGWDAMGDVDYILHLEEDFTFPQPIPIDRMIRLLAGTPDLAQVCLKRQPWSPLEVQMGGFMALDPDAYTDTMSEGVRYVEHTKCFSFNPSLYPSWMRAFKADLEAPLTETLVQGKLKFGYYGSVADEPRCFHIGERRSAGWML